MCIFKILFFNLIIVQSINTLNPITMNFQVTDNILKVIIYNNSNDDFVIPNQIYTDSFPVSSISCRDSILEVCLNHITPETSLKGNYTASSMPQVFKATIPKKSNRIYEIKLPKEYSKDVTKISILKFNWDNSESLTGIRVKDITKTTAGATSGE